MAIPLIAMAVLGGVRMAAPHVAKYLAKQGFKKASATAAKKAPNAPKMNMTQARKAVQDKNVVKRPTTANRNYQRNRDGSLKLKDGKPVLKPGVSPAPKAASKVARKPSADRSTAARKAREAQGRISAGGSADDAVAAGASRAAARAASKKAKPQVSKTSKPSKPRVSDVATRTVKPARKVSGAAKEEMLKAAGRRASEVGKRMSKASDKKPGRSVAVRKTTQPAKTSKPKVPARISKTPTDKGKIVGLSRKGKAVAGGLATTAAAVALDQALKGGKSGTQPAEAGKLPSVQAIPKPKPKKKPPVPDAKKEAKPKPKPVDSGRKKYNKGFETMKEYFVDDMSGRKSKVKTPFGMIDIDTSEKGMAMEEFDSKYGGQIKGTVKRRMGGQVRGYGKALRGY